MPMPNFFVIGAARAGTTSLYRYLSEHPDVYMSPVKEPGYFFPGTRESPRVSKGPRFTRTLDEYLRLFDGVSTETAVGEASTVYLSSPEAAQLVREAAPDARLIAVLRHPAERAFSHYCLQLAVGNEELPFAAAVAPELDEPPHQVPPRFYVLPGFYGRHLSRYLECFERDRIRIYLYEDLQRDRDAVLRDVFAYLGVDPSHLPRAAAQYNVTRYPARHESVERFLRFGPARAVAKRMLPRRRWRQVTDWVRRRNSVVPEFPLETRRRLIDVYRDDIRQTEEIVGRDLSAWLT